MTNAFEIINRRVKQLKKKMPGVSRSVLIKKASAEYRAGKLGAAKRGPVRAKSSTKKKAAGKKKIIETASVRVERVAGHGDIAAYKAAKEKLLGARAMLWRLRNTSKRGLTDQQKKVLRASVEYWRKEERAYVKIVRELKKLI